MCTCITKLQNPALYSHPKNLRIQSVELPTALIWDKAANRCYANTISLATLQVEGKTRPEKLPIEHSYCPFCGEKKNPDQNPNPTLNRPRCYIAGPITGLPKEVYTSRFETAKQELIALGIEPVSPLDLPHQHDDVWAEYIREDLAALLTCQQIYLLSGWETSRGARVEALVADQLGLQRFDQYNKPVFTPNS